MRRHALFCIGLFAVNIPGAGATGLFEAIRANDESAVASLLGNETDANSRNQEGATVLMYAALHAGPTVLKLLLDHGADPNLRASLRKRPRQRRAAIA